MVLVTTAVEVEVDTGIGVVVVTVVVWAELNPTAANKATTERMKRMIQRSAEFYTLQHPYASIYTILERTHYRLYDLIKVFGILVKRNANFTR